mmetsp:Transcript_173281/g.555767  ORF Transcript_173281/g.555767 Transcript_173281/m.555767 type:complete len:228 (-) Transcript_173281:1984-2667(-)
MDSNLGSDYPTQQRGSHDWEAQAGAQEGRASTQEGRSHRVHAGEPEKSQPRSVLSRVPQRPALIVVVGKFNLRAAGWLCLEEHDGHAKNCRQKGSSNGSTKGSCRNLSCSSKPCAGARPEAAGPVQGHRRQAAAVEARRRRAATARRRRRGAQRPRRRARSCRKGCANDPSCGRSRCRRPHAESCRNGWTRPPGTSPPRPPAGCRRPRSRRRRGPRRRTRHERLPPR